MSKLDKAASVFGSNLGLAKTKEAPRSKDTKEEIEFGEDLDTLAALNIVADTLNQTAQALAAELKQKALGIFSTKLFKTKEKPDTFLGVGHRSDAQVTLKKRASNSPLSAEELSRLRALNITVESGGVQKIEKVPERFVLNPDVVNDQELLKAIAGALAKHPKLKGVPIILQQDAEEIFVTSDETIPQLARAVKDPKEAEEVLPSVTTISMGKYHIDHLEDPTLLMKHALDIIQKAKLIPVSDTKKKRN